MLPRVFVKTKIISMVLYKWQMKIIDQFSWVIVCQQKTDLKQPTSPCGLGLKTFCFSSDNVFWNSCISQGFNRKRVAFLIDISDLLLRRLFGREGYLVLFTIELTLIRLRSLINLISILSMRVKTWPKELKIVMESDPTHKIDSSS